MWMVKLRAISEQIWKHWSLGFAFIFSGAVVCTYWLFILPAPGYAVAVMGVAAALMAGRTKASGYEKAAWMLVMFGLLFIETLAIRKDRNDNEAKQQSAHNEQRQNFTDIGNGIKSQLRESQRTMERVNKTLEASEAAQRNTRKFADLELEDITPSEFPPRLSENVQASFNVFYRNVGSDAAEHIVVDAKDYVGPFGNKEFQKNIGEDFDKWWTTAAHQPGWTVVPGQPKSFFTFNTHNFTGSDIESIREHTKTIYFLTRWTYRDKTGRWIGDNCLAYQDPVHDTNVVHPCTAHNNHRYCAR